MSRKLVALLNGEDIGRVHYNARGRLSFVYTDAWRQSPQATPLSLSMPMAAREHGHAVVEAFLSGLLPDNDRVLARWAARFQVSPRNVFALIAAVGEDCAGAIQFLPAEHRADITAASRDHVEWLSEADIAQRLKALRADQSAWRIAGDTGQFSLAGAQPKTALLFQDGRWGVPSGRIPTTHILKPPLAPFDGHAENEHLCLQLARALGLPTAASQVMQFDGEPAIVVERFDRQRREASILRVHQEDMCQALSVSPTRKYQNEGGPGALRIIELLRTYSSARDADLDAFADALGFNWLIAGTDAHAKNFAVLLVGGQVRLAPLYDLASILPYPALDPRKAKLAMNIGGEYKISAIGLRQWRRFARDARLDGDRLIARLQAMAAQLPDAISALRLRAKAEGLVDPIVDRLAETMIARAGTCQRALDGE